MLFTQTIHEVLGDVRLREKWADYSHVSDAGIVREVLADNALEQSANTAYEIEQRFCARLEKHINQVGPFAEVPGARRFFDRLHRSSDYAVAIATGGWRSSAILKLASAGFDIASVPLATSSESTERTAIMRLALQQLSINADSVTYFGDAVWDRDATRALGWSFVAIGPDLGGLERYPATPQRILHSLAER